MNSTNKSVSLRDMQTAFYEGIFNPRNEENLSFLTEQVAETDSQLNSKDRIAIYRGSILGGITDALTNIYPVCVKLVGETFFTHMVAGYLKQYPSGSPDLGDYGEHLWQYISDFTPAEELFYMPDVARLEWHWHKAFNAEESQSSNAIAFSITQLAEIPETQQPNIQFCLTPTASLMTSEYPVHRIWQVNQDDHNEDQTVNLDEGTSNLIVWRSPDYGMRIDLLTQSEFEFLSALNHQKNFAEVATLELNTSINELLPKFIQMGLITGFNLMN